jgi:hypothetical protein
MNWLIKKYLDGVEWAADQLLPDRNSKSSGGITFSGFALFWIYPIILFFLIAYMCQMAS